MKFKVTYEMTMTVNADGIKDVDPSCVAECLHSLLDYYEDGRYDLARETLQALTRGRAAHAVYQALTAVLFKRYGNRLMLKAEPGSNYRINAVSGIAQRRLKGVESWSHVDNITVQKIGESVDD